MLLIPIGLVMGKSQHGHGTNEKQPAVSGKPDGHGKTSQAETGQDQGELSAKGVGKRRGDGAAAGEFIFHFYPLSILSCCCRFAGSLYGDFPLPRRSKHLWGSSLQNFLNARNQFGIVDSGCDFLDYSAVPAYEKGFRNTFGAKCLSNPVFLADRICYLEFFCEFPDLFLFAHGERAQKNNTPVFIFMVGPL
jgi:hypothetical protein